MRVVDKVNKDSIYLDCQCTKRGDVIVACEDGHVWGKDELANPDWRIFQIPALPLSQALAFCSPELPVDPLNPSKTLQKRAFKFNLDDPSFALQFSTVLADSSRTTTKAQVALSDAAVAALKVAKPPIPDPAVIGKSPTVIG